MNNKKIAWISKRPNFGKKQSFISRRNESCASFLILYFLLEILAFGLFIIFETDSKYINIKFKKSRTYRHKKKAEPYGSAMTTYIGVVNSAPIGEQE